jgi:hypothetical protein
MGWQSLIQQKLFFLEAIEDSLGYWLKNLHYVTFWAQALRP